MPPFISAWLVMVLIGALGHMIEQPKLFISYWIVLLVLWVIRLVLPIRTFSVND